MDVPKAKVKLSFSVSMFLVVEATKSLKNLFLQCFDLVDKDWMSKSDPIVVLQERKRPEDPWTFVGRTELIKDNQNPVFKEKITLVVTDVIVVLFSLNFDVAESPGSTETLFCG